MSRVLIAGILEEPDAIYGRIELFCYAKYEVMNAALVNIQFSLIMMPYRSINSSY